MSKQAKLKIAIDSITAAINAAVKPGSDRMSVAGYTRHVKAAVGDYRAAALRKPGADDRRHLQGLFSLLRDLAAEMDKRGLTTGEGA